MSELTVYFSSNVNASQLLQESESRRSPQEVLLMFVVQILALLFGSSFLIFCFHWAPLDRSPTKQAIFQRLTMQISAARRHTEDATLRFSNNNRRVLVIFRKWRWSIMKHEYWNANLSEISWNGRCVNHGIEFINHWLEKYDCQKGMSRWDKFLFTWDACYFNTSAYNFSKGLSLRTSVYFFLFIIFT